MANLYRDLRAQWDRDATSTEALRAFARWCDADPLLGSFSDPAGLLGAAEARDPDAAEALERLCSLVAADSYAAHTVLVALLPGIAALAREHRRLVGATEPFDTLGDLDQFLVGTAYERITMVAAETPRYRLATVLARTRRRVRMAGEANLRERRWVFPTPAPDAVCDGDGRSSAEQLALVLIDAVAEGVLRSEDARLVYATRIAGHSVAAVAATMGARADSLVRRRTRVERLLAARGAMCEEAPSAVEPAA